MWVGRVVVQVAIRPQPSLAFAPRTALFRLHTLLYRLPYILVFSVPRCIIEGVCHQAGLEENWYISFYFWPKIAAGREQKAAIQRPRSILGLRVLLREPEWQTAANLQPSQDSKAVL
ncbi:hypothetical protein ILYODFUR_005732 [Ilyodon furcidens]|uniref:Uncharacterized protein n=1 Tax=Ilyodon furcidens TaxID=33524 RepID=A0ABV0SVR9_9TELE